MLRGVLSRRAMFARLAAVALGTTGADRARLPLGRTERQSLGFCLALPRDIDPAMRAAADNGARLGIAEAGRAAAMFGWRLTYSAVPEPERVRLDRPSLVLGGLGGAPECIALATIARAQGFLVFNIAAQENELRRPDCFPLLFHFAESESMRLGAGSDPLDRRVTRWHHALERYGAAQLNDRYHARFGQPMDGHAWAAWLAIKVGWETALRAQTSEPTRLAAMLADPATRFDGHKGRALAFDARHQLNHPLYAVPTTPDDGPVTELPMPPAAGADAAVETASDRAPCPAGVDSR